MPRLEIHRYSEDFRGDAARLLGERHARERAAEPLLPEVDDYAAQLPAGDGAVATRGGAAVAYLLAAVRDFHGTESAVVDIGGCAASEPEAVRDLYAHLGGGWPERHFVFVPTSERELVDVWFRSVFGCQAIMAIREPEAAEPPAFAGSIRETAPDDLRALAELEQGLWDLLREPPSHSALDATTVEEHEEGWRDLWDEPDKYWSWVAERDGRVVAAIVMYRRPPGDLRVPADNVDLAFAGTYPDDRGSGAGVALTQHVLHWAHEQGFRSVTTDWRSVNLLAARFWPRRGFRPTHYRLYRAVP